MLKYLLTLIICLGSSSVMALEIVAIENQKYHHILTTPAQKVVFPLNAEDKSFILLLKDKLHDLSGVGLAAPQVNYARQIVAVYIPEEAKLLRDNVQAYPMHILINPSYISVPGSEVTYDFEGCYSVNSKAGKVPRYNQIKLTYFDESGKQHMGIESGFYARTLQHEIDHIHGILITDRLTPDCVQGSIKEMMAIRRAELSPEKRVLFDELMERKCRK